jgi:O-methyltransferase
MFKALAKLVRKKAKKQGVETESDRMITIIRNNTMVSEAGLFSLYQQAVFCEQHRIAGDFVECGVWKGGSVGLMALVNLKHGNSRRHIHLFDSFEEICEPDEEIDGERAVRETMAWAKKGGTKGRLVPLTGIYDQFGGPGTIQENKNLLERTIGYDPQYIHFHKGWFQHTMPEQHHDIDKIAILRIDADWYASTKICLDYFFDKVISGGFVIIDDYGTYDGCKKAVDEFLATLAKPLYLNYVNSEIRYVIAP